MQTNCLGLYNSNNLTYKELVDRFVIRQKEFRKIFNDIKNSDMKYPEQHYIIDAQAGYGKTTLLKRLYFEVKADMQLKVNCIAVILADEQYNIRRLFTLWEMTAQRLELESDEFIGLYAEMDKHSLEEDYDEISFKILERKLNGHSKKLILLIDNIDSILKKFKLSEQQKLREILLTSAEIRIIGATPTVAEFTFDYNRPFYDFFKIVKLEGLNLDETKLLFLSLGEISNNKHMDEIIISNRGKIETFRRLTAGVPRIMAMIFEITSYYNGLAFTEFNILLDKVTPIYKYTMDGLSPVQQEIVDVIALRLDAITTKEISDKIRMQSKEVSAQLNQLEKNGVINKIPINKKNYMYQIKDRFFNIWYLMRFGAEKEKQQVLWLVDFFESWCSKEDLINKSENSDFNEIYLLSKTLLSNDEIEGSLVKANLFLKVANNEDKYNKYINEYLILLMAKKQYNSCIKLFNENDFRLKDKFRPTYYALMYFMKNQDEKFEIEYRKIGEELEETIGEIIEEVKNSRK